jgi:hypothetical protein
MKQQQECVISTTFVVVVVVVPSTIPNIDKNTIPDHLNPQYTHAPLPVLLQMCQELSEILMIDAFGKSPFPWQKTFTHLNFTACPTSGIPPLPTFLCAPTDVDDME